MAGTVSEAAACLNEAFQTSEMIYMVLEFNLKEALRELKEMELLATYGDYLQYASDELNDQPDLQAYRETWGDFWIDVLDMIPRGKAIPQDSGPLRSCQQ
jgi:hypothetical protein